MKFPFASSTLALVIMGNVFFFHNAMAEAPLRPVKLMRLQPEKEVVQRRFFGQIRAKETVDLAFQVGGQITQFPVKEGTRLQQGDLIAKLDTDALESALKQAKINLKKAERELQRYEKLLGSSISKSQVEDAKTAYELAQINVEDAERQLGDATLTAPFDAMVARREVANFSTITAGTAVVRLQDVSEWRVDIEIPEILAQRTSNGTIKFEASFAGSDKRYPLELREFETEATSITQTYNMTLGLAALPTDHRILPGSSVVVIISVTSNGSKQLAIPKTALIYDSRGMPQVMVFHSSQEDQDTGTVTKVPVEIQANDNAVTYLVKGPEEGAEIVSSGASQLEDGQSVRRFVGVGE
nr:efflux RND transporter periplasmic adaptor subunit [uncultured Cohaesibacter sp.]